MFFFTLQKLEAGYESNEDALHYGISPLHAWMRFFECLLHISYRMEIKKWKITKDLKAKYLDRKKLVTEKMYEAFGVRVDQPRAGGAGTSTTGNVCRKAFSNPELLSKVLDIDEELIVRFRNILIVINCEDPINPKKMDDYCKETYRRYLNLYDWYKIPATVHKVLAHAGSIIIHSPAPLGMLAEEAAECQHKLLKKCRTHHARKRSRVDNLHDVFIRAMNSSDPLISSINLGNRMRKKVSLEYPDVVKSLLVFEDLDSSENLNTEGNALGELMDDVEQLDDDFALDENVENE